MQASPIERKRTRIFADLVAQRRATRHFRSDPVPEAVLETALELAAQAPSGYNFQPWRFLVLTEPDQRAALRAAAFDQGKITEAPVVIVAFGEREGWKSDAAEILRSSAERRGQPPQDAEKQAADAIGFVAKLGDTVWLNRQVMIAFTHLMLAFETLGWDTAPMEGFDNDAVKKAFDLPADAEVVALLAVGRSSETDEPHPGRRSIDQIAHRERYGTPFAAATASVAGIH